MDEALEVMPLHWSGERLRYEGRRLRRLATSSPAHRPRSRSRSGSAATRRSARRHVAETGARLDADERAAQRWPPTDAHHADLSGVANSRGEGPRAEGDGGRSSGRARRARVCTERRLDPEEDGVAVRRHACDTLGQIQRHRVPRGCCGSARRDFRRRPRRSASWTASRSTISAPTGSDGGRRGSLGARRSRRSSSVVVTAWVTRRSGFLSHTGADVVVVDRAPDRAETVRAEAEATGVHAVALTADVTTKGEAAAAS